MRPPLVHVPTKCGLHRESILKVRPTYIEMDCMWPNIGGSVLLLNDLDNDCIYLVFMAVFVYFSYVLY